MLGVAFISGTLVLTATITNTFDDLFTTSTPAPTRSCAAKQTLDSGDFGEQPGHDRRRPARRPCAARRASPPPRARCRATPSSSTRDGEAIGEPGQGAPTLGVNCTGDPQLEPVPRRRGPRPARARRGRHRQGDRRRRTTSPSVTSVPVVTQAGPHQIHDHRHRASSAAPTARWARPSPRSTPPTAPAASLGSPGQFTTIASTAEPGVSQERGRPTSAPVLPDRRSRCSPARPITKESPERPARTTSRSSTPSC